MTKSARKIDNFYIQPSEAAAMLEMTDDNLEYLARLGLIQVKVRGFDPDTGEGVLVDWEPKVKIKDFAFKYPDEIVMMANQLIKLEEQVHQFMSEMSQMRAVFNLDVEELSTMTDIMHHALSDINPAYREKIRELSAISQEDYDEPQQETAQLEAA